MWARVESNSIQEIIRNPKPIKIGDTQYSSNIFSLWETSELQSIGLYPVEIDETNIKDSDYYNNGDISYSIVSGQLKVKGEYPSASAKPLDNVLWTDSDDIPDGMSVGDIRTYGLKNVHKDRVNDTAGSILQPTDWMVIREAEGGTSIPSATKTWRAAVRTKANAMTTAIDNVSDVDELAALYVYNSEDPPVRPLGEFPILGG